jgi:histidyl-tRNA synthetase
MENKIISKNPYKGAMDWYPEDMYARNLLFQAWIKVAQKYGYEEYDTPLLEDANLYRVKSGDEIANNQLYSFTDKGDREIALRPEMTPSLARIVAAKKNELSFPLRWFNIGRFYRYEKPQKGRRREFVQLNIDILGMDSLFAEVEIIRYVMDVMKELKAPQNTYELRVNSRYLLDYLFDNILILDENMKATLGRALDNYLKMPKDTFEQYLGEIGLNQEQKDKVLDYLTWDLDRLGSIEEKSKGAKQLLELFTILENLSVTNVVFSPSIVRGLAYYTGTVIEMYDVGKADNPRALFGGGRYDNLLEIFDEEKIPAFGLGWGDITTMDYLKSYDLIPPYKKNIDIYITLMDEQLTTQISLLTSFLRENGLRVLQQLESSKLSKQLKYANKENIPWVIVLGQEEIEKGVVQLKDMNSRESFLIKKEDVIQKVLGKR